MSNIARKINASDIFDCRDLSKFNDIVTKQLPFSGASEAAFFLCHIADIVFLTKINFYRKSYQEMYDRPGMPPADAEISILNLLKTQITDKNLSPCILELIYYKICVGICDLVPNMKVCSEKIMAQDDFGHLETIFCKYADMVRNGLAHDKCAFMVLDQCDMTLDSFIKHSSKDPVSFAVLKSIIFMILHAIYIITLRYPRFHHYDLHTENVLLKFDTDYKFSVNDPKFLLFNVSTSKKGIKYGQTSTNKQFYVPYFGIIPKLIDFGYSEIPEENIVSAVINDQLFQFHHTTNDMLKLLHWIHHRAASVRGNDYIGPINDLMNTLDPTKSYLHLYPEHMRKIADELPSYKDMIKSRCWDEYTKFTPAQGQIYKEYAMM
jgi:hypothetical protein